MLFSYGLVVSFCKFITGKRTRDSGGEGNGIHVFKSRQTEPIGDGRRKAPVRGLVFQKNLEMASISRMMISAHFCRSLLFFIVVE